MFRPSSIELHDQVLDMAAALVPMRASVCQLATAIADQGSELSEIVSIVESDPVLISALLREANSAMSAPANEVTTIRGAVTRLGFSRTLATGSAASIGPQAQAGLAAYELQPGEMWRRAIASSHVAEIIHHFAPDRLNAGVVTAALLSHLGQIILDQLLEPTTFAQASGRHPSIELAEQELIDLDHAEVGAMLLEIWNVPSSIVEAVRHHHDPHTAANDSAHVVLIASTFGSELHEESFDEEFAAISSSFEVLDLDQEAVVAAALDRLLLLNDR